MAIKIKIYKIFPWWTAFLILAFLAQAGPVLFSPKPIIQVQAQSSAPEVLGASIDLRGQPLPKEPAPEKISEPDISKISAKSFLVFDLDSGNELLSKNSAVRLEIASLTKLMTAWVAYQTLDLNGSFTVAAKDSLSISPVLGLLVGDDVKTLDVFNAMLIGSCNDAALALANYGSEVTGENFISLMNQEAKNLGLNNTHFANPLGFDSQNNYSTAEDLKTLISQTEKLSAFSSLGRKTSYEFSGSLGTVYKTTATNKLLDGHPDISAIKTGFTEGSQGAMATKVSIGNREMVILVLDSQNREADTLKLKDLLLKNFQWN